MELRNRSSLSQKNVSQSSNTTATRNVISLSQPAPSTSGNINRRISKTTNGNLHSSQQLRASSDRMVFEEQNELVNSLIRYLLISDRGKQVISKIHLLKNVFCTKGKYFHETMQKAETLLSETFGYQLIELPGNKYILVNEIQNQMPHIYPTAKEGGQQVLLFLVLVHIFMTQESCSEESLWSFLTNLDIPCSDNQHHDYFGNVKRLITEVFVAQKYLEKIVTNTNETTKTEYKWGPRAEHEFSRRSALEFVSEIYCGRPISNWSLQYKALQAREKATKS